LDSSKEALLEVERGALLISVLDSSKEALLEVERGALLISVLLEAYLNSSLEDATDLVGGLPILVRIKKSWEADIFVAN
jgi:hypothetical protein